MTMTGDQVYRRLGQVKEKRKNKRLLKHAEKDARKARDVVLLWEGPTDNILDSMSFFPGVGQLAEMKKGAMAVLRRAKHDAEKN